MRWPTRCLALDGTHFQSSERCSATHRYPRSVSLGNRAKPAAGRRPAGNSLRSGATASPAERRSPVGEIRCQEAIRSAGGSSWSRSSASCRWRAIGRKRAARSQRSSAASSHLQKPQSPSYRTAQRRSQGLPGSGGPDGVKPALVKRKQPTGCDLAVDDLVQAHGGPAMVDAADRRKPVGKRGEPISVPNENFSSLHLERAIGEVSSSSEVVEYLL